MNEQPNNPIELQKAIERFHCIQGCRTTILCPYIDEILSAAKRTSEVEKEGAQFEVKYQDWMHKYNQLHSLAKQLAEALSPYAKRDMWTDHVIDSYSGLCWFFDWAGDLQDEPYEIAEKALSLAKEQGLI